MMPLRRVGKVASCAPSRFASSAFPGEVVEEGAAVWDAGQSIDLRAFALAQLGAFLRHVHDQERHAEIVDQHRERSEREVARVIGQRAGGKRQLVGERRFMQVILVSAIFW